MNVPDPDQLTPSTRADLTNVVFLKNEVTSEFIEVGAYTYADSEGDPTPFEQRCVKYLYGPQKLRIGKFSTIGPGVTILPGVSIGDGAVIGACSVVTKDVEAYHVVAGNPARPIRTRFSEADIRALQAASWWDWPIAEITRHAAVIMGGSAADLTKIAEGLREGA